jgi:hypothetical protein
VLRRLKAVDVDGYTAPVCPLDPVLEYIFFVSAVAANRTATAHCEKADYPSNAGGSERWEAI